MQSDTVQMQSDAVFSRGNAPSNVQFRRLLIQFCLAWILVSQYILSRLGLGLESVLYWSVVAISYWINYAIPVPDRMASVGPKRIQIQTMPGMVWLITELVKVKESAGDIGQVGRIGQCHYQYISCKRVLWSTLMNKASWVIALRVIRGCHYRTNFENRTCDLDHDTTFLSVKTTII